MRMRSYSAITGVWLGLMLVASAFAQPETKPVETLGIGVSAGLVGGSGFSFRKLPSDGMGFQVATMYLRTSSETYFNLGYEALYVLKRTRSTALYAVAGMAYTYNRSQNDGFWDISSGSSQWIPPTTDISKGLAGGAGIGVALRMGGWDQVWLSLDLLLTAYHATVLPYPQAAAHYFFK